MDAQMPSCECGHGALSQLVSAMAKRMNRDLVFDHSEATRDFRFELGPFVLGAEDV